MKKSRKVTKHSTDNLDNQEIIAAPEERQEYYCKYCNCLLTIKLDSESYYCSRCECQQFPSEELLKKKSRLITPERNTETLISEIPTGFEDFKIRKKQVEIKGTFRELQRRGLRITDYKEDVGG